MSNYRTAKARRVIQHCANGKTMKSIEDEIHMSYSAIKNLMSQFFKENKFTNMTHAVAESFRKGLIQ